jgi:hypothetical protein
MKNSNAFTFATLINWENVTRAKENGSCVFFQAFNSVCKVTIITLFKFLSSLTNYFTKFLQLRFKRILLILFRVFSEQFKKSRDDYLISLVKTCFKHYYKAFRYFHLRMVGCDSTPFSSFCINLDLCKGGASVEHRYLASLSANKSSIHMQTRIQSKGKLNSLPSISIHF